MSQCIKKKQCRN